jgi:hypothetical protein
MSAFFNALKEKERPQKLAQTKAMQEMGAATPNVTVHSRRQTMIDKEKQIGRWKVIEAELEAREIPVFGPKRLHAKPKVDEMSQ